MRRHIIPSIRTSMSSLPQGCKRHSLHFRQFVTASHITSSTLLRPFRVLLGRDAEPSVEGFQGATEASSSAPSSSASTLSSPAVPASIVSASSQPLPNVQGACEISLAYLQYLTHAHIIKPIPLISFFPPSQ